MNLIPLAIQYPCEFNTPLENLWGFLFSICYACIILLILRYFAKCCTFFVSLIYIYKAYLEWFYIAKFCVFYVIWKRYFYYV